MVLFLTIVFGLLSVVYGVKTSQELLLDRSRLAADAGHLRTPSPRARRPISSANIRPSPMSAASYSSILVILLGWWVAFGFLLGALFLARLGSSA